jgi:CPA2 family monovalent cation:H+ antiporter-2/glutathione-regulated potassium-efflux system protein KefB
MALEKMGLGEEEIGRAEDFYRANDKERLSRQIASGDVRAGREIIVTRPKGRG